MITTEGREPRAGHANYPGNACSIVGQVKGPTLLREALLAVEADYDPAADRTRVGFDFTRRSDVQ